jgi:multiple sugar transport system substrate-binding protein
MDSAARISRRNLLKAGSLAGISAALYACGAGTKSSASAGAAAGPSGSSGASLAPSAAANLSGRVSYWHHFAGNENIDKGIAKQFAAFQAKYPDIDFKPDVIPNPEYMAKLTTASQTGALPDAALIAASRFIDTLGMGAVTDVTDRIKALPTYSDYPESYFTATAANGIWYGLPQWLSPDGMLFYRKDWLAEAGFTEAPKTWDELQKVAIAITDPAKNRYGYGMRAGDLFGAAVLLAVIYSFGSDIVDAQGKPALDRDMTIEAVTYYSELFTKYQVVPPSVTGDALTEIRAAFQTGQTGMLYTGFSSLAGIADAVNFPVENIGIAVAPSAKRSSCALTVVSNVMTSDRNADATWAWLSFWADADRQAEFYADTSFLPTMKSAYQDPRVASSPHIEAAIEASQVGFQTPQFPGYTGYITDVNATWQAVLLGKMTPTAWTDDAIAKLNTLLA